jgi:hypothetical protein
MGGLVHDHVGLAALETRQAGESLVRMIMLGVVIGGLLLSAWLGMLAVVGLMLVDHGFMSRSIAVLILAVGANLLLAWFLGLAIRRLRTHLQFPATVRTLKLYSGTSP